MKKVSALPIVAIFFLAQAILQSGPGACAENYFLNPPSALDPVLAKSPVMSEYCIIGAAIVLYNADVVKRLPREELIEQVGLFLAGTSVRFDPSSIGMLRNGRTRCYTFWIGDSCFVARICPREARILLDVPVLREFDIRKSGVILQILPGVNDILKDRRIQPYNISSPAIVDKSA